jgi:acetyl esterase/lipase
MTISGWAEQERWAAMVGLVCGLVGTVALAVDPVEIVRGMPYYDGPDANPRYHQLDLYLPRGRKDFPVLFFVHGGGWTVGDKDHLGIYTKLGRCLARQGIGMVSPNYRLSPSVRHPEHVKDVARAFAWTHRHIARYGGRPDELFVGGHSAGGHLTALLATDARYLKEVGLSLRDIRGAIPLSGVLVVPSDAILNRVFGSDPEGRKRASPIAHCSAKAPPFLIVYADNDLYACDRPGAEAFCRALREEGGLARTLEVKHRNHLTILWKATADTDPVALAMTRFIAGRVLLDRVAHAVEGAVQSVQTSVANFASAWHE